MEDVYSVYTRFNNAEDYLLPVFGNVFKMVCTRN